MGLLTKAMRLIVGRDSGANDLVAKFTDAGIVCNKIYALDTDTIPNVDVEVAADAQGRLKSSGVITAHVDEIETKLDTVNGHIDTLEMVLGNIAKRLLPDAFKITDEDRSEPAYYGYTDEDENWFIMKATTSGSLVTYRYKYGSGSYAANWTGRAGLSYGYWFDEM